MIEDLHGEFTCDKWINVGLIFLNILDKIGIRLRDFFPCDTLDQIGLVVEFRMVFEVVATMFDVSVCYPLGGTMDNTDPASVANIYPLVAIRITERPKASDPTQLFVGWWHHGV